MTQSTPDTSPAKPELPKKLNGSITEQFLESNRQRIPVTIKHTLFKGDRINLYSGGPNADAVVTTALITQPTAETDIQIDAIKLRKLSPGTHAMYYDITPQSGTPVQQSTWLLYKWLVD